ncbi:TetR/AcrR family transcriptional regulator [Chitinimonas koreensis]|uniref:TetR/AcrR family transcriptional regulator n=1 Tax=Chitinimonas koreensis TaxID=356302 RepID=UPI00223F9E2A|nr:TetR/AcrR family transcriptional regulator [Chitinimonas koreensis]
MARSGGVTKKTLYSHFPTKEALIDAALRLREARFLARLDAALAARPPREAMRAYVGFILDWSGEADFHGCAFINASAEYAEPEAPPHRLALAHKRQVRARLAARLAEAAVAEPAAQADALFLLGEGLIVAHQVDGATDFGAAGRQLLALLEQVAGLG